MNDNADVPNAALRNHVTDHSFVLALRKTHIRMLIAVANNERPNFDYHNDWITPANGLKGRGLMLHCIDVFGRSETGPQKCFTEERGANPPINTYYRLTPAGWAVYDLLVEAGMANAIELRGRKVAA